MSTTTTQPSESASARSSLGGIQALRPGVDLHRRSGSGAGFEDRVGVEGRLRPAPADQDPAGAVAQDVGVRTLDGPEHPPGHVRRVHPEFGMDAGHHDVELREQLLLLIECAILEDVDLDAGEDTERSQLALSSLTISSCSRRRSGVEAVGDGQPGAVVGSAQ